MTPKHTEAVEPEQDEELEESPSVESLSREETRQALYALLFVSDRPVSADRLAEVLGDADKHVVETLLEELKDEVADADVPFSLREIAGG